MNDLAALLAERPTSRVLFLFCFVFPHKIIVQVISSTEGSRQMFQYLLRVAGSRQIPELMNDDTSCAALINTVGNGVEAFIAGV